MYIRVAPFVGAWIEIRKKLNLCTAERSLRSSERGLKCFSSSRNIESLTVAPFVGAWIEMPMRHLRIMVRLERRSVRRSVD